VSQFSHQPEKRKPTKNKNIADDREQVIGQRNQLIRRRCQKVTTSIGGEGTHPEKPAAFF
jgi:hypothetical protein